MVSGKTPQKMGIKDYINLKEKKKKRNSIMGSGYNKILTMKKINNTKY
jgi:hypothetical protein